MLTLFKGLRFGMMLQIAIGPVCVFIFQTAMTKGFWAAEAGMLGVTLIDAFEIMLAALGVGKLIEHSPKAKTFLKFFGTSILFIYGCIFILGAFGVSILPSLTLDAGANSGNTFIQAAVLTLSSPLTIVFWTGIFSAQAAKDNMVGKDLTLFAIGCIISTVLFLTFISFLGSMAKQVIPTTALTGMNAIVGLLLIYFGFRSLRK